MFYGVFLGLEALLGFCTILINIPLTAYFQAHVPLGYQGRFFAFFVFTAKLAVPLGMAYTGQLSQKMGPDSTYILNNVMVILIVLIVFHKNKAKPDT
ncbi:ABC transporter permease protein YliD [Agrilactobacillus composti DSM 18527 = JCM 14202]|uniref:hypothetical protein n=1 Tax=Agrilactobacillus composti TaxID=398555 RepID=UPI00042DEFDE|nr:hypothetical protein [Agrilactobacillus composti]GAF40687.1 ABC transporter permease protein YliD [Agrilactobacillus composti DSM 18527 = JCM 14202]